MLYPRIILIILKISKWYYFSQSIVFGINRWILALRAGIPFSVADGEEEM